MTIFTSDVTWHNLINDPDDLPEEGEPFLVTVETFLGRQTWLDVHLKYGDQGKPIFYTFAVNNDGEPEESVIWYPVVAWAYPPDPFDYY